MVGALLRHGDEEEGGAEGVEQVESEQEQKRRHHEEELDLIEDSLENRLVVDVPGDADEGEQDEKEEAEVERHRRTAVVTVRHRRRSVEASGICFLSGRFFFWAVKMSLGFV